MQYLFNLITQTLFKVLFFPLYLPDELTLMVTFMCLCVGTNELVIGTKRDVTSHQNN